MKILQLSQNKEALGMQENFCKERWNLSFPLQLKI